MLAIWFHYVLQSSHVVNLIHSASVLGGGNLPGGWGRQNPQAGVNIITESGSVGKCESLPSLMGSTVLAPTTTE